MNPIIRGGDKPTATETSVLRDHEKELAELRAKIETAEGLIETVEKLGLYICYSHRGSDFHDTPGGYERASVDFVRRRMK